MDTKKIRFLSHMGSRGAFGQAIYDLAQEGVDFWAISAIVILFAFMTYLFSFSFLN